MQKLLTISQQEILAYLGICSKFFNKKYLHIWEFAPTPIEKECKNENNVFFLKVYPFILTFLRSVNVCTEYGL